MQLEVLVTDAVEAVVAQLAGATRVELVKDPDCGGLTPSFQTIKAVTQAVSIPVHVIVRPHGNGFNYDRAQRQTILGCAARLRELGAAAVVFGALDAAGRIAAEFVREVLSSSGLPMTFHRAFDQTPSLSAGYAALSEIPGVERVLTAGGAPSAWDGRFWLRELCGGETRPSILAAGAIDAENLQWLVRFTGLREIHVGRGVRTDGALDAKKIEQLVRLLKRRNHR